METYGILDDCTRTIRYFFNLSLFTLTTFFFWSFHEDLFFFASEDVWKPLSMSVTVI